MAKVLVVYRKLAKPVLVQGRPDGQATEQLKALGARLAGVAHG